MIFFGENGKAHAQTDLMADTSADIANLDTFTEDNGILPGSSCYVIATSDLYVLDSTGTWKKQ